MLVVMKDGSLKHLKCLGDDNLYIVAVTSLACKLILDAE